MSIKQRTRKFITRRQFIQSGATAATGLLLAACTSDSLTEETPPTEALSQNQAANTPRPIIVADSPSDTPTSPATATGVPTTAPTETAVPQATATEPPPTEPAPLELSTNTPGLSQTQHLISDMTLAATLFSEALDPGQRDKAVYAFNSDERFRWHWTTPRNFPRNGLPLREMSDAQRSRAFDLLQASLSSMGFEKSLDIISLQNNLGNDPELFFVTLFGQPGAAEPWGWRWEGHHLSRQFTVVNDKVAMTPFFLGSWPTTTEAGLRAMASEEDAALELVNSFSGSARDLVLFQDRPITRHVTQNAAQVSPLDPVGMLYPAMSGSQQQLVTEIIQAYLGTLPAPIAGPTADRINEAGLDQIRFGWAGSVERRQPQYFRLQGPTFLLEYDNTRNRGTHIHSVWRDFEQDFGYHLL